MRKILLIFFLTLIILSFFLEKSGWLLSFMSYGDYDIPHMESFVQRLKTGIGDTASTKIYKFDSTHFAALFYAVGLLFPAILALRIYKHHEWVLWGIKRGLVQWISFVVARLGILRVSGICPMKRSLFGYFPFINCQACELATGACPVGMLQISLLYKKIPYFLIGYMGVLGLIFGGTLCGWICPLGLIGDIMDRFSLRKWKIHFKYSIFRYIIGVLIVIIAFVNINELLFFCVYICPGGLIFGLLPYYVTTGIVPFAEGIKGLISSPFGNFYLAYHILLLVFYAFTCIYISGRFFCRHICVLGGFFGLFNRLALFRVEHISKNCISCGKCDRICPMQISLSNNNFLEETCCISCLNCVKACPVNGRKWVHPFESHKISGKLLENVKKYNSETIEDWKDKNESIILWFKNKVFKYTHVKSYQRLLSNVCDKKLPLKKAYLYHDILSKEKLPIINVTQGVCFQIEDYGLRSKNNIDYLFEFELEKKPYFIGLSINEMKALIDSLYFHPVFRKIQKYKNTIAVFNVNQYGYRERIFHEAFIKQKVSCIFISDIDDLDKLFSRVDYLVIVTDLEMFDHYGGKEEFMVRIFEKCESSKTEIICFTDINEQNIHPVTHGRYSIYPVISLPAGIMGFSCECGSFHFFPGVYAEVFDKDVILEEGEGLLIITNYIFENDPFVRVIYPFRVKITRKCGIFQSIQIGEIK